MQLTVSILHGVLIGLLAGIQVAKIGLAVAANRHFQWKVRTRTKVNSIVRRVLGNAFCCTLLLDVFFIIVMFVTIRNLNVGLMLFAIFMVISSYMRIVHEKRKLAKEQDTCCNQTTHPE